jgi:DNA polymerase I
LLGKPDWFIVVHWLKPGERVRFYRTRNKTYAWLPDENEEAPVDRGWDPEPEISGNEQGDNMIPDISLDVTPRTNATSSLHEVVANRRDYNVEHYLNVLVTSYAARLRKAFSPGDFEQLFRLESQPGLFDQPIESIEPRWIRYQVQ